MAWAQIKLIRHQRHCGNFGSSFSFLHTLLYFYFVFFLLLLLFMRAQKVALKTSGSNKEEEKLLYRFSILQKLSFNSERRQQENNFYCLKL
jgi:hypothetical protein